MWLANLNGFTKMRREPMISQTLQLRGLRISCGMCGPTYRYYPQLLIKRGFPTSRFRNMWFFRCSFEIVSKHCKEEEGMRMPCPCRLVLCAKMSRESAKKGLKLSTTHWLNSYIETGISGRDSLHPSFYFEIEISIHWVQFCLLPLGYFQA